MEDILEFYYDITNLNIKKYKDYYIVKDLFDTYLLEELLYDKETLKKNIDILNNTNILYHLLILTKDGNMTFSYDDKEYVLLKIREDINKNVIIFDFNEFKVSGTFNWGELWSKRIDYYETQVEEVIKDESVKYSLQYYIGLSENAISMFNDLNELYDNNLITFGLSHHKLEIPLNVINFYDPVNIFVDNDVRDLSEYVKAVFFEENLTNSEILTLVDKVNFTEVSANYFLDRLLYPSYFFKVYDEYIESKNLDKKIFLIIKKSPEFEMLLKQIYSRLIIKYNIKINSWIFKSQH